MALTASAVVAGVVIAFIAFRPRPIGEPLRVLRPEAIIAVRDLSGAGPLPPVTVLGGLADAPQRNGTRVNWSGARLLRIELRTGLTVSLQIVRSGSGALVRVTADASQSGEAQRSAALIRGLRGNALYVSGASAIALLGDLRESRPSTNLSTIIGVGAKQEHRSPDEKNM